MRTIETDLTVRTDGRATVNIKLPLDIELGQYHAVIIIDDQPIIKKKAKKAIRLPRFDAGLVDEQFTFRREDLYGNDGR